MNCNAQILVNAATSAGYLNMFTKQQMAVNTYLQCQLTATGGSGGFSGGGSPEGVVTANPGSKYLDTNSESFWVKKSGTGNTGWIELIQGTTALGTPTLHLDGSDSFVDGSVLKVVQPASPDLWEFWNSDTGTGNPDSNPGGWFLILSDPNVIDAGNSWDSNEWDITSRRYSILRFLSGASYSPWSNTVDQI